MKTHGYMRVLMIMTYKGYPICVRQIGTDMFLWDTVYNNQFYSSYIVMKPKKGSVKLTEKEIEEVIKMCYAGAAATVDTQLGTKLDDTQQMVVDRFESARKQVDTTKLN